MVEKEGKIINKPSIKVFKVLRQGNPDEYVNIETQTYKELSADYISIAVGSNDGLPATVAHKNMETESGCYQLVGSLSNTIDLLKVEIKDKQARINNLMDTTKDFTVNENKKDRSREPQEIKVHSKSNNDDIVSYYTVISFIIDFKH